MTFRTCFIWLWNLIFPCFSFTNKSDTSNVNVDQESPGFDSSCTTDEKLLPVSVSRVILPKRPVENIRVVCKSRYKLIDELSDEDSNRSDSYCLSELPNSVIHEILLKLPTKSIAQCRYVCKHWYKLISDPYFSTLYLKNPTLTSIAFSQHKIIIRSPDDESFGFLEIGTKGNVKFKPMNVKALTVPRITNAKNSCKILIGSCDGLLCLVETLYEYSYYVPYNLSNRIKGPNQTVWIVNPLIGQYMELPDFRLVDHDSVVYGFGSTAGKDHYKVIRVARKDYSQVVCAQIITIGVDKKWRDLDISTFPKLLISHAVTVNGVFHWQGYGRLGDTSRYVIYAFDIGKETGRFFAFPFEHHPVGSYLVSWDGHLCITDNINKLQVDLWTMKRYGVMDLWQRDVITKNNNPSNADSSAYLHELVPVTTMRNGDLLLFRPFDQRLIHFDPRRKKCVELQGSEVTGTYFSLFAYTPSFVSLRILIQGGRNVLNSKVLKLPELISLCLPTLLASFLFAV